MTDFIYDISLLHNQYYRPLCYFAEGLVGDAAAAEDLATDTFIKLLKKPVRFESASNLKSYLYTITKNGCLDHLRKMRRHDSVHADMLSRADIAENNAEHQMIRSEILQTVCHAIENLPMKYRQIVELALLHGKKNEEIAADLHIAAQTVRNRKSEGYKLLRVSLGGKELLSLFILADLFLKFRV